MGKEGGRRNIHVPCAFETAIVSQPHLQPASPQMTMDSKDNNMTERDVIILQSSRWRYCTLIVPIPEISCPRDLCVAVERVLLSPLIPALSNKDHCKRIFSLMLCGAIATVSASKSAWRL